MICYEGQPFAANFNPSYKTGGLKGHTGEDWGCGFGTPIYSRFDGIAYKVLTKENPAADGSGFTGVFMIVDDGIECFEWLVGHCDPCVVAGQRVRKGDLVGHEANHGTVYVGNIRITLEMQAAGDQRGAHRHYQKRLLMPSRIMSRPALSSNSDANGSYLSREGFYYIIQDFHNGFNGCVDPGEPVFGRDLYFGMQGYDVYVLQRLLKQGELFKAPECTGYFGPATGAAVARLQKAAGISPAIGYFGPKTRREVSPYLIGSPGLSSE